MIDRGFDIFLILGSTEPLPLALSPPLSSENLARLTSTRSRGSASRRRRRWMPGSRWFWIISALRLRTEKCGQAIAFGSAPRRRRMDAAGVSLHRIYLLYMGGCGRQSAAVKDCIDRTCPCSSAGRRYLAGCSRAHLFEWQYTIPPFRYLCFAQKQAAVIFCGQRQRELPLSRRTSGSEDFNDRLRSGGNTRQHTNKNTPSETSQPPIYGIPALVLHRHRQFLPPVLPLKQQSSIT